MGMINKYRKIVNDKLADRRVYSLLLEEKKNQWEQVKKDLADGKEGLLLIQKAVGLTQEQLEAHISNIVTLALESVDFKEPYKFVMKFVTRRNNSECDIYFDKRGHLRHPLDGSGGGAVDVASFALRCAFLTLEDTRKTVILDEPFKNLSPDLLHSGGEMIKMVSDELGIQFIIVSNLTGLSDTGDRIFSVELEGEKSKVEVL